MRRAALERPAAILLLAQEELDRLVNKGDTALHDVTAGFEQAAKDLDQAIRKAFSRFS